MSARRSAAAPSAPAARVLAAPVGLRARLRRLLRPRPPRPRLLRSHAPRPRLRTLLGVAAAAFVLGGCGDDSGLNTYASNDLVMLTAYTAKEACSCLFVMAQSEDYCRLWVRENPPVADFRVNEEKRTVEATALLFWGARARFVDDDFGCVLD